MTDKLNPIQILKDYNLPKPIENGQVSIPNVATIRNFLLDLVSSYRDKEALSAAKLETSESKAEASELVESLRSTVLGTDEDAFIISAHRVLKAFVAELAEYLPGIISKHRSEVSMENTSNRSHDAKVYDTLKNLVVSLVSNAETAVRIESFDTTTPLSELFPQLAPFNDADSKRAPGQMTWPNFTATESYGRSHSFVTKLSWTVDGEHLPLKSTPNDVLQRIWPVRSERPTTGELYDMFGNVNNVVEKGEVTFIGNGHTVVVKAVSVEQD